VSESIYDSMNVVKNAIEMYRYQTMMNHLAKMKEKYLYDGQSVEVTPAAGAKGI